MSWVNKEGVRRIRPKGRASSLFDFFFYFSFSITCIYLNIYIYIFFSEIIINSINNIKNLIFRIIVFKLKFIISNKLGFTHKNK
jgi:hypothetical protein